MSPRPIPLPTKTGLIRGGLGYVKRDLDKAVIAGSMQWVMLSRTAESEGNHIMSDVKEAYEKAANTIEEALTAYTKVVSSFRGAIKNDLVSIAASATKVQSETHKMQVAYTNAINTLTSENMERAITNAERLAKALEAISSLKSNNITFAVLDTKAPG